MLRMIHGLKVTGKSTCGKIRKVYRYLIISEIPFCKCNSRLEGEILLRNVRKYATSKMTMTLIPSQRVTINIVIQVVIALRASELL